MDSATDLGAPPPEAPQVLRILAVTAVCLGVAALAAATFVLSYSAIRTVALQAGITPRLARGYPLLLDAMLVIVLAAILALRGAGLPSRFLAWVTLLLVMTVAAGADALHTAGRSMPHQAAAITAAVLPFVLVLVAFVLLLVMLRHARLRRLATSTDEGSGWVIAHPADAEAGERVVVYQARTAEPARRQPRLAVEADPAGADPSTDDGVSEPATGTTPYPADTLATGWLDDDADDGPDYGGLTLAAAAPGAAEGYAEQDDDGPVFHRLFSAPTPLDVEPVDVEQTDVTPTDIESIDIESIEMESTEVGFNEDEKEEA